MANKFLKGLAIAAGTGVVLGFGASLGRQRKNAPRARTAGRPTDLELRVDRQAKEIAALRAQADESGRRASIELTAFERRLAAARAELPAAVEAAVTRRVEELRTRLHSEIKDAGEDGLARIDQVIDEKLASRVTAIETALTHQSGAIGALNRRAIETDTNLQKLILSVERLCDSAGALPAADPRAAGEPSFLDLPFEAQYDAALQREASAPVRMFASLK
jgi:uncharacterized coiled-coil protein SlyX